jgi:hypothetical protein
MPSNIIKCICIQEEVLIFSKLECRKWPNAQNVQQMLEMALGYQRVTVGITVAIASQVCLCTIYICIMVSPILCVYILYECVCVCVCVFV